MKDPCIELILSIAKSIGLDFEQEEFCPEDLLTGIVVELEHGVIDPETDVTEGSIKDTAKIAWAHLNEHPDYYKELSEMEKEMKTKTAAVNFEELMRDLGGDLADGLEELLDPLSKEFEKLWYRYEESDQDSDTVSRLAAVFETAANDLEQVLTKIVREFHKRK